MMIDVNLDSALSALKMTLQAYYDRLDRGEEREADLDRSEFRGAKFMVEALCGPEVKQRLLQQLRERASRFRTTAFGLVIRASHLRPIGMKDTRAGTATPIRRQKRGKTGAEEKIRIIPTVTLWA